MRGEEKRGRRIAKLVSELPDGAEILATAFGSPAVNVQVNAARGIALLGPKRAGRGAKLVADALTGGDARTQAAARETMQIIVPPDLGPPPIKFKGFDNSFLTPEDLGKAAPRMRIDSLVLALCDGRPYVRANAATALQIHGENAAEAVAVLSAAVRDESVPVRIAALLALGAAGKAMFEVAHTVVDALGDEDPKVVAAARAVATAAGPRFIGPLVRGLETDDRQHAEHVLRQIISFPDATDILCDAFECAAVNVQVNAALGLGMLGASRVGYGRQLLEGARTGGWLRTRNAVFEAIDMLTPRDDGPQPIEVAGFETKLLGADAFDGKKLNLASIFNALSDGRDLIRANAATAFGASGDTSAGGLQRLGVLVRDNSRDVRLAASQSAAKLGEAAVGVADDLVGALRDTDPAVIGAVSAALSQLKSKSAQRAIARSRNRRSQPCRQHPQSNPGPSRRLPNALRRIR